MRARLTALLAGLIYCGCGGQRNGDRDPAAIYQSIREHPRDALDRLRSLASGGSCGLKFLDRVISEGDDDLAVDAIQAISELNSDEAIEVLIDALQRSSEVRGAARQRLEAKGDRAAMALMRAARGEDDRASNAAAALAGFSVQAPKLLLPFLVESLHHKLWDVRFCALWMLRYYGKEAKYSASSVRDLLKDPEPRVAMMAKETLASIE